MKYSIGVGLASAGVWLLWSGHYTGLLLALGAVSVILVVLIVRRMEIADEETAPLHLPLRLPLYLIWLVLEIAKANMQVALCVLRPGLPISPRIIRVRADQRSDIGRVIYANSITLTPGTVSIDTEGDMITVHALTEESAAGVETGAMNRRVAKLEGLG